MVLSGPLRHVFRRLGRAPPFTVLPVATLARALGANTAIFSVLNGILLRPLPSARCPELAELTRIEPVTA
jgi:putative ABC transport system permease protein